MDLVTIEGLTKDYADARRSLADRVQALNDEIEAAKKRLLPGIKRAVEKAAEKKAALSSAVLEGVHLFERPRTVVISGIKVGLEKGKGKIEWEDDEQVVRLIEKHFPEQADVLIQTKKKPLKKALANLSAAELKKIGVVIEETGDQVVIKGADSDVDKLVKALLREDEGEDVKEAA
ncbi:MAG: hypothetical protein OHK006_12930 [Thermodesulfovibrionales bacterium]